MTTRSEVPLSVLEQYFRVPTGDLPVDYRGRPLFLGSCITNVSKTGVYVRTSRPLALGAVVDLAFSLPGSSTVIEAGTVVRWTTATDLSAPPPVAGAPGGTDAPGAAADIPAGMGLEFTRISRAHRRLVNRFVSAFLQRMRAP